MNEKPTPPRPECDIEKTGILDELFRTPVEARNEDWQNRFLSAVSNASFACQDPQVLIGPDGFPYFALFTPEPGVPFESFCIQHLIPDFLLANGVGVAINPSAEGVDWIFSYGDILNFHLRSEFYSESPVIQNPEDDEAGSLIIFQPSEDLLPMKARHAIKDFLKESGVSHPAIFILTQTTETDILQSLVFNIFEEDFETPEAFNHTMSRLQWFLPKHYFISRVPKDPQWLGYFYDL